MGEKVELPTQVKIIAIFFILFGILLSISYLPYCLLVAVGVGLLLRMDLFRKCAIFLVGIKLGVVTILMMIDFLLLILSVILALAGLSPPGLIDPDDFEPNFKFYHFLFILVILAVYAVIWYWMYLVLTKDDVRMVFNGKSNLKDAVVEFPKESRLTEYPSYDADLHKL